MNAENLVKKKGLLEKIASGEADFKMKPGGILHNSDILSKKKLVEIIESPAQGVSPAELGGDSWVLEELKEEMREIIGKVGVGRPPLYNPRDILKLLNDLESQAPAELAEQTEENERKAKAWDKLYDESDMSARLREIHSHENTLLSHMKDLLAQSKEEKP